MARKREAPEASIWYACYGLIRWRPGCILHYSHTVVLHPLYTFRPARSCNSELLMKNTSGSLKVRVIKGTGLRSGDKWMLLRNPNRRGDPYVVVRLGNQVVKTHVVEKDLNPRWEEELSLWIPNTSPLLKLEVLDKDWITRDDKIGDSQIDLQPFANAVTKLRELRRTCSEAQISKLASKDNYLFNDNHIHYANGIIFQDVCVKLQNVDHDDCGELELQLKWVEHGLE